MLKMHAPLILDMENGVNGQIAKNHAEEVLKTKDIKIVLENVRKKAATMVK